MIYSLIFDEMIVSDTSKDSLTTDPCLLPTDY